MSPQLEEHIGRFALKERLASTSLATLYRAEDPRTGHRVAVKALRPFFGEEPELLAEYFSQSQRIARLEHPHIVSVSQSGEDGSPWVAMEFMGNGSLAGQMEKRANPREVGKLLSQIGAALDAAHQLGIVHGDLKPSNVFMTPSGDYKLADFGMATLAAGAHPLVRASSSTPLPSYMAPEQALDMSLSERSDVYSLAVLAYHMLTGRVPHQGTDPTTVWAKQLRAPPPRPEELNPQVPAGVSEVLLTAIATNPDNRYASPGEFAKAFAEAALAAPAPAEAPAEPELVPLDAGPALATAGRRIFCRVCNHANDLALAHCEQCRALLWPGDAVEEETQEKQIVERRLAGKRRRAVPVGLAGLAVLVISALFLTVGSNSVPLPATSVTSASAAGEWAMHQRDPTHSGYMPGPSPALEGTVKWTFMTPELLLAAPAVTGDTVYLATGDRRIVALSAEDGTTIWEHPLDTPVDGTPAVTEDTVYVALRSGKLVALNRQTGDRKWTFAADGPIFGAPTVKNGVVYVGDWGDNLNAVDAATGELLWRFKTHGNIYSSIAVSDEGIAVVVSGDGNVYFVDTETGGTRYFYRTVIPAGAAPAISGDRAFIGTENGVVLALDMNERRRPFDSQLLRIRTQLFIWGAIFNDPPPQRGFVWANGLSRSTDAVVSTPIATDSSVYVTTRRGSVFSLDKATSLTQWSFRARGAINTSAALVGDTLYVGSDDGMVYGLDAAAGEVLWQWEAPLNNLPSTSPVIADGALYVGTSQERPKIDLFQLGDDGKPLPEEPKLTDRGWHYRYGPSPCSPEDKDPVGPFPNMEDARWAAIATARSCGVLYAIQ